MNQLKKICLRATKTKSATKIEVLEMAIGMLAKVRAEPCMNFQAQYDAADASVGGALQEKAENSGTNDVRRSIRERKRRIKVNPTNPFFKIISKETKGDAICFRIFLYS